MKFVINSMAGRLAKWLRILGIDAVYIGSRHPENLKRIAEEEGRIVITRNKRLKEVNWSAQFFFLSSEKTFHQLEEVVKYFNLENKISLFTRCPVCNTPLKKIKREEARGRVPFFVFKNKTEFASCPVCDKVYWRGTHIERIRSKLQEILEVDTD